LPANPCICALLVGVIRLVSSLDSTGGTAAAGNGPAFGRDGYGMKMKRTSAAAIASLAMSIGVIGAATTLAAPAAADPGADEFLSSLTSAGLGDVDPATATAVGQSVCPMLAEPGQQLADVAANVSNAIGKPLGPATTFTGLAITLFCPSAVSSLAEGQMPIPLGRLGF